MFESVVQSLIDDVVTESAMVEKMEEKRRGAREESFEVENELIVDVGETSVETSDKLVERPAVEPVAVRTDEDQMGSSSIANQLEDQPDVALIRRFLGTMVSYTCTQSSAPEQVQGLMTKLEDELAKIAQYTKLTWQWERTYNAQVEFANKAYATLITSFKEMKQEVVKLREAFIKQFYSDISSVT